MSTVTTRKPPRAMLALIALATDLPMPRGVTFFTDEGNLSLSFWTIADGSLWADHFGEQPSIRVADDGYRYLRAGTVIWHGWNIHLNAYEPVQPDVDLAADERAALTELAEARP